MNFQRMFSHRFEWYFPAHLHMHVLAVPLKLYCWPRQSRWCCQSCPGSTNTSQIPASVACLYPKSWALIWSSLQPTTGIHAGVYATKLIITSKMNLQSSTEVVSSHPPATTPPESSIANFEGWLLQKSSSRPRSCSQWKIQRQIVARVFPHCAKFVWWQRRLLLHSTERRSSLSTIWTVLQAWLLAIVSNKHLNSLSTHDFPDRIWPY